MPASTSATWRDFVARPSRFSLPAMFIRQPRSPASSVPAPVAAICCGLLLDDGVGDVGIFDAERAAEAAADVGVRQLAQVKPRDRFQQLARLPLDAELAQPGAGIVIGDAFRRDARRDRCDAEHVGQEAHQLVGLLGKRVGARLPIPASSAKSAG